MFSILVAILCLIFSATSALDIRYYWKDYYGDVPQDAFRGGSDLSQNDLYIGQAYIHGHGLAVVKIAPGQREVDAPMYGVKKSKYLKVLCIQDANHFQWLPTNNTHLHTATLDKYPVIGGYDLTHNNGALYIGRVMYQGELKFGSIAAYDTKSSLLYFPHGNEEKNVKIYEVLVNNEKVAIDIRNCKK